MFASKLMVCTACGYAGVPTKVTKGSVLIEIILWLCFLVPGLIYSIWRISSRYNGCPKCQNAPMIPSDSPNGKKLLGDDADKIATEFKEHDIKESRKKSIIALVVIGFIVLMVGNAWISSQDNQPSENNKPPELKTVFDSTSVLEKPYTQIKAFLGEPSSIYTPNQRQLSSGVSYSATWEAEGISLQIDYLSEKKPVRYLFIGNNSNNSYSVEQLEKLANVQDLNKVKVVPQTAISNPSIVTGIHICSLNYKGEAGIVGSENCK